MMLDHLGENKSADRIFNAIKLYANNGGPFTPDLGGEASTSNVIDSILKLL